MATATQKPAVSEMLQSQSTRFTQAWTSSENEGEYESDGDSAIDDIQSTNTQPLDPSVSEFPVEHGRRYHALRPGNYALPNDRPEMERLEIVHEVMIRTLGHRLFLTPLEESKVGRVLDMGTGTGIWAMDFANRFRNAEVIGNDLSPIQPSWVPPNVRFVVDDLETPWSYKNQFDFIFGRYLVAAIKDWPGLVKSAFDNVRPGGWVEFQDFDLNFQSDDCEAPSNYAVFEWDKLIIETARSIGREPNPGLGTEGWMRAAGFVDVTHRIFKIPVGGWPKDPELQEIGYLFLAQTLDGLEAFSLRLLCGVLGWDMERVQTLLAKVKKDLTTRRLKLYMDFHVVYGRKPE